MGQETQDNIYTPKLDSVLILVFLILPYHLTWLWTVIVMLMMLWWWSRQQWWLSFCTFSDMSGDSASNLNLGLHGGWWLCSLLFFLKVQHYILHFIISLELQWRPVTWQQWPKKWEDYLSRKLPRILEQWVTSKSHGIWPDRQDYWLCDLLKLSSSAILKNVWLSNTEPRNTIWIQVSHHSYKLGWGQGIYHLPTIFPVAKDSGHFLINNEDIMDILPTGLLAYLKNLIQNGPSNKSK